MINFLKTHKGYTIPTLIVIAYFFIIGLFSMVSIAYADRTSALPFYLNGASGWVPNDTSYTIGSPSQPFLAGYFTNLFASSTSFSHAGGALDMGGYAITNAGTITGTNFVATSTTATSTFAGPIWLANGTASMPSLSFSNLTNAGLYYDGSGDDISLSANGGIRVNFTAGNMILTSADKLSWGSSAATSPDLFFSRGTTGTLYIANASGMTTNTGQIGDATHLLSNIFSTLGTFGEPTSLQGDVYIGQNTQATMVLDTANSTPANSSRIILQRSDGTKTARTNNSSGDLTGDIIGQTWSGGSAWAGARIQYYVDAAVVNNQAPSNALKFYTVPQNGSQTLALTINSSQNIGIATATPVASLDISAASGATTELLRFDNPDFGGSSYIAIGKDSGVANDMILGAWANNNVRIYSNSLERVRVDNNGNVGVADTSPDFPLEVVGSLGVSATAAGDGNRFIVNSSGNVGVATTSPWRTFGVTGTVGFDGLTTAAGTPSSVCMNATTKEITVNAALTCTVSARDQKNSIEKLNISGIDTIMKLNPVSFKYNDADRVRWGFIADELQAVSHQLGDGYDKNDNARSIDIPALISASVKAIQEQQKEINDLKDRITKLEK